MATLTQLKYVLSLNKNRHFGKAAKECFVSQPSLSAQIQKLEDELGIVLFDRSKKPIMVTAEGEAIIKQAKKVLDEYQKLFDIGQEKTELSGDFNLGIIPTLSPYLTPLFVRKFSEKYPRVKLKINEYKTSDILKGLDDDTLDGGLLVTPLHDDSIIERVLFYEPFYIFSSEHHPLNKKKRIKESDLDTDSLWLLNEGHCFRDQVIKVCSLRSSHPVLKNIQFESGSLDTLMNLIRQGNGYTLIPHLATVNLTLGEKNKRLRSFQNPAPSREVSLVHSRSFLKQRIIEAIEEEIIQSIPDELISLKKKKIEIIEFA